MSLVYANALLIVLVLLELIIIHFKKKDNIPWREIIFNLNSGHILMWVLRGLEVSAFYLVTQYWSFNLLQDWPLVLIWIFTLITWDFCFYWLHRIHHKYRFLWAIHVVHHEGEHFSLSLGIRNSWYSSLSSFPFFVILAFIGVPVEVYLAASSIHYIIQFYNHNSLVKNSGFLEKILITPSHHLVHHGLNPEYIDRNFGGTFIIWDKLFGTFQPQLSSTPVVCGVKEYQENFEIVSANNLPFLKLFKPKQEKPGTDVPHYKVSNFLILSAGILLFAMLLVYVSIENSWTATQKIQLFSIIFLGTIANGGISENKFWGLALWLFCFLIFAPFFTFSQSISSPILISLFAVIILHSVILLFNIKRNRKKIIRTSSSPNNQ